MYYKEALARTLQETVQALVAARRSRWELGRNLEDLARAGHPDGPAYQSLQAAYQELSRHIDQAQEELKGKEEKLTADLGPSNPLKAFRNFLGVPPLGGVTLGPKESGKPGIVSNGPEVVTLQKFLRAYGYQITATGEFDVQTRLVMQKFQEEHDLPAPNETVVGVDTRQLINDMLEGK